MILFAALRFLRHYSQHLRHGSFQKSEEKVVWETPVDESEIRKESRQAYDGR